MQTNKDPTTPQPQPPLVTHPKPKQFTLKLPKLRPPSFRKSVPTEGPTHKSLQLQQEPAVPELEKHADDVKEQQQQEERAQQQPQPKKARQASDSWQKILELECRMDQLESELGFTAEVMHKTLVRASLLKVATNAMLRDVDTTVES